MSYLLLLLKRHINGAHAVRRYCHADKIQGRIQIAKFRDMAAYDRGGISMCPNVTTKIRALVHTGLRDKRFWFAKRQPGANRQNLPAT